MRANRDSRTLIRECPTHNHRRLKFCRCDISAEANAPGLQRRALRADRPTSLRATVSARGTIRSTRGRCGLRWRRRRLRGRLGVGRFRLGRDGRQRRTGRGMNTQRRRRRAGRHEVGIQRDEAGRQHGAEDQKVLQDQHRSPKGCQPRRRPRLVARRRLRFNRGPVWRYQGRCSSLEALFG